MRRKYCRGTGAALIANAFLMEENARLKKQVSRGFKRKE